MGLRRGAGESGETAIQLVAENPDGRTASCTHIVNLDVVKDQIVKDQIVTSIRVETVREPWSMTIERRRQERNDR